MVGLETLPRRARGEVVRVSGGPLRELPQVSSRLLAALKELRLPGEFRASTVEFALRREHAQHRACVLHTLDLSCSDVRDVSALASCASLHTLYLCQTEVRDVSALAGCGALHTLNQTADEAAFFFRVYGRTGSVCIALRVVFADAGTPARSTGPKKMSTTLTRLRPCR